LIQQDSSKAETKLALEELIKIYEGHFIIVPDGIKFQVDQCFSKYFPKFSSPRSFIVEVKQQV
jgi:hypothetical protein